MRERQAAKKYLRVLIRIIFVFWLLVAVSITGCQNGFSDLFDGDDGYSSGEFVGTVYSVTSLIDPLTAAAELCYIPPIKRYAMKFRDGIHPDSGRGPVLVLSPNAPFVSQLFDGSSWETDWRWYRRTQSDIIFYFDKEMPEGLTSSEATRWFQRSLPITSTVGKCSCTLHSYERNAVGAALTVAINW